MATAVTMATADKPCIVASSVAAAIGKHPYSTVEDALYKTVTRSRVWAPLVAEIHAEGRVDARTALEHTLAAAPAVEAAVTAAVTAAAAATSDGSVAAAIDTAVAAAAPLMVASFMPTLAGAAPSVLDAVAAAVAASSGATDVAAAVDRVVAAAAAGGAAATTDDGRDALLRDAATAVAMVSGVGQSVQMARGVQLEGGALDAYAAAHGTAVTQRNAVMHYLRTPTYVVAGKIDGWDAARGRVVEVKNRKRAWATVPQYDVIQLRVYLEMTGAAEGVLVDRFPDGTSRETIVTRTAHEWAPIHDGLCAFAARFAALTPEEVATLVYDHCVARS